MSANTQDKAIRSRSAPADPEGTTTHDLFARDVILPALAEDPEGCRQTTDEFTAQLSPSNLLERHYVEKIAAAVWRLRCLRRWQAQLFQDAALTEDQRLDRLGKTMRHETALHRQVDTAVKMLNKDVPQLCKGRARDRAIVDAMQTEPDCRENCENELKVVSEARAQRKKSGEATADPAPDYVRLDAAQENMAQNCQNEPAPAASCPKSPSL